MIHALVLTFLLTSPTSGASSPATELEGAWQTEASDGTVGTWIVSGDHFSIAWYRSDPAEFLSTEGGTWAVGPDDNLQLTWEFATADPDRVGTTTTQQLRAAGAELIADGRTWRRIDSGSPGDLQGAWLMTGRKRDGEISTRMPGARRTMKILSGTRFQWIAYNVETRQFFGTGGGTYTTEDGRYTENLEFFSRDDKRVGTSLPFKYELVDGVWHHSGKSTAGAPMYELWSPRADLGI